MKNALSFIILIFVFYSCDRDEIIENNTNNLSCEDSIDIFRDSILPLFDDSTKFIITNTGVTCNDSGTLYTFKNNEIFCKSCTVMVERLYDKGNNIWVRETLFKESVWLEENEFCLTSLPIKPDTAFNYYKEIMDYVSAHYYLCNISSLSWGHIL